MKKINIFYLCLVIIATIFCKTNFVFAGDTGTYKILEYKVSLVPQSDGIVKIDYYQKWQVTGGHIPWVTVGVPNENFTITARNLDVAKVSSASEGSWQGVRVDLKRDYKPGETFQIAFQISQNKLFYADKENYKMEFTPGWYDNAAIDDLGITIKSFAKISTVRFDPQPTKVVGEEILWSRKNLGHGEKFQVSISFPKNSCPKEISKDNLKDESGAAGIIFFIVLVVLVIIIIVAVNSDSGGYSGGGGIFFGGGGSSSSSGSSGGGGFGGRSSSCACACVSCACACACAGGGGAGCSRKSKHSCPKCDPAHKKTDVKKLSTLVILFFIASSGIFFNGCSNATQENRINGDPNEPGFRAMNGSWVVDTIGVLPNSTIVSVDKILEKLKQDGVAEVVILLQNGIKKPEEFSTLYGRWAGLGRKGPSTAGGNNGVVWLIRPDTDEKITISVGRGLPKFTSSDYAKVMEEAKNYINFGNYEGGVEKLAIATDKMLREIYPKHN